MPVMSLFRNGVLAVALFLTFSGCNTAANDDRPKVEPPANNAVPAKYGYQILNIWPHDSNAFTQGLILADGKLLESTGQEGSSSLRHVEPNIRASGTLRPPASTSASIATPIMA